MSGPVTGIPTNGIPLNLKKLVASLALLVAFASLPAAALPDPAWTRPQPPFRIAGNLYYVGSEDLASYLIVTPQGNILINSNLESSVPQIQHSVQALGFRFSDIKILLVGQGHFDHCAGSARVKQLTHAQYAVMDADVSVVQSGGRTDFYYGADKSMRFPPAHVDRVLHDGEQVRLGGTVLVAHLTAGHNKGTTTWTLDEPEAGKLLHVVIVGGSGVNTGYKLVHNAQYPQIAADYARGFAVLKALPCDIFLGAHGGYFDMRPKYERWLRGDRSAFIDPDGYRAYIAGRDRAFEAELKRQSAAQQ